ncbi:Calcium-dependent protein kinase 2 [Symbiodinium microadriaticum]|uniref:non-specific serine/threonine protein kinase n=1 Tax=Symbiodinium microadriaticum TaxID=2951 RepID=A0A1Q9EBV6_SYMMI|nr:Calcium-dependent protein kinase 2 [Symbiodinium microadriaticum]
MAVRVEVECALTREGDDVCLVGASPALGNWDPSRALQLNTGPSLWPRWAKEVALAHGTECKLIIRRRGGQVEEWEGMTGNRSWPAATPASTVSMKFGVPAISFDPVKAPAESTKLPQPPAVALPQPQVAGYRPANAPASPVPASPSESSRSGRTPKAHKDLRQKFILDMNDGYEQNIEERFDLDEKAKLGDGAFSVVTRATNRATGAVRAMKSVLKSRVQKVEALKNEIDLARDMDHPNIVRLYGIYEDPRHVYLVMELCEGGELFDRLSEVYSLGEKGARACMRQVFASVAYCHSKGIVHRDLKPENYLLYDKDKPLDQTLLKLIDFGLAKPLPEAGCLRTRVGTAYYVAPEVLAQAYTEAADVWSSGVIMYIMLCGAPPFNADKDSDILRLVKKGQYSMESGVWRTVSTTAKSLIKACLEMDHKKRITAQDALSHEWFHRDEVDGAPLDSSVLRNLRAFSSANRFRKAALTAVAYQLGEDEQKELREIFMRLDTNGDGYLSLEEIKHGLQQQMEISDLEQVLQEVDSNGDGRIEYTEFLAAAMDQRLQRNETSCWRAFKTFDKDGDGKITYAELQQVLEDDELLTEVPDCEDARFYFDKMDANGDGEVSFEEFMAMLHPKARALGLFSGVFFAGRSLKGADNEAPNALKAACEALRKEFAEDYFLAPAKTRLPPDEIVPRLMKLGGQAEACQEALAQAKQKKSVNAVVTENKDREEEWIKRLEKGFSLLFEGVGSKYRLLENFAQVLSKSGIPIAIFQAFDKGSSLAAFLRELLEQHGWKGAATPGQDLARRAAAEKHPLVLIIHNLEVLPAPHLSALASLVAAKKEIWLVASAVASALAVDNIFADAAFNMDPHAAMELRGSAADMSVKGPEGFLHSYSTVELKGRYPALVHAPAGYEEADEGQQGVPWDELVVATQMSVLASDLMIANNHTKLRRSRGDLCKIGHGVGDCCGRQEFAEAVGVIGAGLRGCGRGWGRLWSPEGQAFAGRRLRGRGCSSGQAAMDRAGDGCRHRPSVRAGEMGTLGTACDVGTSCTCLPSPIVAASGLKGSHFNVPWSSRSPFVVSGGKAHQFFPPGMLRIWSVSGDCLASYPAEEAGDVRTLKRKLQSWCGVPRFRQRLLNNDVDLGDDAPLHSAMDLQLILLPFAEEHVDDLATAVENNLVSKVEEVLRRAQNPDLSRQDAVETPLGIAAQRGHVEISRLLLEACADKDKICRGVRKTPLGLACCGGHVEIVRLLLEARADKDNTDGQGITTAIQLASSRGQVEIVRLLLDNTNTKEFKPVSGQGRTALAHASRRGHTEIVRLLLQARAIKKAEDHDCHTALKLASRRGHWEIVRVLQEASATQEHATSGVQCIVGASRDGDVDLVQRLLQVSADPDMCDHQGRTALMRASAAGHIKIAQLLLTAGADADKADNEGTTALKLASFLGRLEIVHLLLDARADTNIASREGRTPLMSSSGKGRLEIARLLLEAGADKEKADNQGTTALKLASNRGLHERFLRSTTDSGHACCGITELQFLYIVEMTFDACESSRQAFKRLLSELTDHQILIERNGRFELAVKEAVLRKLAEGESVEDVDVEGEGDAADDVEHEDEEFSEAHALSPSAGRLLLHPTMAHRLRRLCDQVAPAPCGASEPPATGSIAGSVVVTLVAAGNSGHVCAALINGNTGEFAALCFG